MLSKHVSVTETECTQTVWVDRHSLSSKEYCPLSSLARSGADLFIQLCHSILSTQSAWVLSEVRSGQTSQPAGAQTDRDRETHGQIRDSMKDALVPSWGTKEKATIFSLGPSPSDSELRESHREGAFGMCAFPSLATFCLTSHLKL